METLGMTHLVNRYDALVLQLQVGDHWVSLLGIVVEAGKEGQKELDWAGGNLISSL